MAFITDSPKSTPHVTLFLGAGASRFAGYYTFRAFDHLLLNPHHRAKEGLPELDRDTERFLSEVRQALTDISRPATHDNYLWLLNNYRDFCTKFKTHQGVQRRFERIYSQILPFSDTIQHVMSTITHTTLQHYSAQRPISPAAMEVRTFYRRIAQLNSVRSPHLSLFTTNYDLFLDTLLSPLPQDQEVLPIITGVPDPAQEGDRWNPALFSQSESGIFLYRLHGCVAWFYHGPDDPKVYYHRAFSGHDWEKNLCVMFPGKEIYPGNDPHGFAFQRLYHAFLSSTVLAFIGFSFRDDDVVQSFLAASAARQKPVRLVLVDPYFTEQDLFKAFEDCTARMTLPFRVPTSSEVRCLDVEFGNRGSSELILQLLNEEVRNGSA